MSNLIPLRRVVPLGLAWLIAAAAPAFASEWMLDPAHSSVQFAIRHLMISNVRGEFRKVTGTVDADEKSPTRSKIEATIDAASIDTRNEKRDEHLRSAEFLDVATYPTIRFVSTRIEKKGDNRWAIVGELTLHGVTREVALDFEGPTRQVKDPAGKLHAGGQATAKLDRKDFGITWNRNLDGGGVVVGDEVAITIDVEVTNKTE